MQDPFNKFLFCLNKPERILFFKTKPLPIQTTPSGSDRIKSKILVVLIPRPAFFSMASHYLYLMLLGRFKMLFPKMYAEAPISKICCEHCESVYLVHDESRCLSTSGIYFCFCSYRFKLVVFLKDMRLTIKTPRTRHTELFK